MKRWYNTTMEKKQVEEIMELIGAQPNADKIQALLETEHKAVVLMEVYESWDGYYVDEGCRPSPDDWNEVVEATYEQAENVLWDTVHGNLDQ